MLSPLFNVNGKQVGWERNGKLYALDGSPGVNYNITLQKTFENLKRNFNRQKSFNNFIEYMIYKGFFNNHNLKRHRNTCKLLNLKRHRNT